MTKKQKQLRAERKARQYIRRHQEASHDLASWLMWVLLWARHEFHNDIGKEMPIPYDFPVSFSPKQRNLFRHAGAIRPKQIAVLQPDWAAICRILQARAPGEKFSQADVEMLQQILNFPLRL